MVIFFYTKRISGHHHSLSSFGGGGFKKWQLLRHFMGEIWGSKRRIATLKNLIDHDWPIDSGKNCIGFDNAYIEEKGEYFAISHEFEGDEEFLFPKEKLKQFIDEVERASEEVYSKSIFESSDRVKFIIDDDWNTHIEQVYLNADTSFFENDGSGMPQFRFERIKGYQYKLVQNDCVNDPASLVLGTFIEDVWMDPKILIKSVRFKNDTDNGTMYYGKTFLRKEGGDCFILGLGKESDPEQELVFSEDILHRVLVLNELFLNSVPDAPLDKLPGVIFFTFDEYWNLIPIPLFRPSDKNFVDRE